MAVAIVAAATGTTYIPLSAITTVLSMAEGWHAMNPRGLPPWRGTGSLSSTVPGYVVSYAATPATCVLDLFDRATNIFIMSTVADPSDGSFAFSGLNTARRFDVRARGDGFVPAENDLILSDLTPG